MLDYYEQHIVSKIKHPSSFAVTDKYKNVVSKRQSRTANHVARIHLKTVDQGDVFYLRLLLHHKPARSFLDLRTVDGTVHETFESAARKLGLLSGDEEFGL